MEKPKISFDYSVYGDRAPAISPTKKPVEQAEWSLERGALQTEVTQALASVAPQYESISASDEPLSNWKKKPLQGDPSVLLTIYKRPYHQPGQTELAVELQRSGSEREYFAAFYFKHQNEYPWNWELAHREVNEEYQGNRIFSEILPALENFTQKFGNHKQERQRITLELGQPMVIARFLNKGYEPIAEDRETVEAMLDGSNEHYYCEYMHARSPRSGELIKMDDIDPFCYDDRVVPRGDLENLRGNDVRVTLEKIVTPQLEDVEQLQQTTREQLRTRTDT